MGVGLTQVLSRDRVAIASAADKWEAIEHGLALCRSAPVMLDWDGFANAIRQREKVLPTGLGLGLGVPHVRTPAVREGVGSLVLLNRGVDYGSLDNMPVRVILTVGMPAGSQHEWLLYMAEVARAFRDADFRNRLFACLQVEDLWSLLTLKERA